MALVRLEIAASAHACNRHGQCKLGVARAVREDALVRIDFLDADRDPRSEHCRRDRARIIATMVNDLLSVGSDNQVMADQREPKVFA